MRTDQIPALRLRIILFEAVTEFDFFGIHEISRVKGSGLVKAGFSNQHEGGGNPILLVIGKIKFVFGVEIGGVRMKGFDYFVDER